MDEEGATMGLCNYILKNLHENSVWESLGYAFSIIYECSSSDVASSTLLFEKGRAWKVVLQCSKLNNVTCTIHDVPILNYNV